MNVYKVPETLYDKYHGCGHALVATSNGALMDIVYLRDVIEEYDDEDDSALRNALDDRRIGPTVRYLQSLGEVHIGMCSCYEFIEL
jgi:hypothetical protein